MTCFFINYIFFNFSNTILNMVSNMILNMILNMVLNMSSSRRSWRISINTTLASVSILPVFSRLVLDFILRSSFIRANVSNSNKINEYSSSEIVSSVNAFHMRLLIVLSDETANIAIFSCFSIFKRHLFTCLISYNSK